jgi:hypothetical protein
VPVCSNGEFIDLCSWALLSQMFNSRTYDLGRSLLLEYSTLFLFSLNLTKEETCLFSLCSKKEDPTPWFYGSFSQNSHTPLHNLGRSLFSKYLTLFFFSLKWN